MNDKDKFRILLSTDNHLGFLEKDPIRGNDSFVTFEEILNLSEVHKPDFVLLGGDLFHENKPSLMALFKCTELIRKYSFNNDPINFKIISDQSINFGHSERFKFSNFNDQNLNVGMPIFTIHGNHDDPVDQSNLCALDLFHASGLVNLFGKTSSVEFITIQPILLVKGDTKVALYGLGAIRNERLHRLFQQNKISFLRPTEQTDEWFSVLVMHQNRVKHGATNYIPESFLPPFIDLVLWGHEHDCRIDPEFNVSQQFYVTQPGSSVATSLCEGEAAEKFIGLLEIRAKEFRIEKLKLQTVRPLIMDTVVLEDEEDQFNNNDNRLANYTALNDKVEQFCHARVRQMLATVPALLTGHKDQPKLPLIRLAVDYSGGFDMFSVMRFSQRYIDQVANPKDMILLHRRREQRNREASNLCGGDRAVLNVKNVVGDRGLDGARVEDLVRQHFRTTNDKLAFLSEKRLGQAIKMSVIKDNKDIVNRLVDLQIDKVQSHLKQRQTAFDYVGNEIQRFIEAFDAVHNDNGDRVHGDDGGDDDDRLFRQLMASSIGSENVDRTDHSAIAKRGDSDGEGDSEIPEISVNQSKRGATGRGRGRGRGRAKPTNSVRDSVIADDESFDTVNHFGAIDESVRKRKNQQIERNRAKMIKSEKIFDD